MTLWEREGWEPPEAAPSPGFPGSTAGGRAALSQLAPSLQILSSKQCPLLSVLVPPGCAQTMGFFLLHWSLPCGPYGCCLPDFISCRLLARCDSLTGLFIVGIKGNNQSTIPKNHSERMPDPECGVGLVARVGGEWGCVCVRERAEVVCYL